MAESKNPNKLYDGIRSLQDYLESIKTMVGDVDTKIKEMLNDANEFGGVISRVFKEQLVQYFLPEVQKVAQPLDSLINGDRVPGSLKDLTIFLDSVPLAMIRQEPTITELAEPVVPKDTHLNEPSTVESDVDKIPQNASFANPVENNEIPSEEPLEGEETPSEPTVEIEERPTPRRTVEESMKRKAEFEKFKEYAKKKKEDANKIKVYQVVRTSTIPSSLGADVSNIEGEVVCEFDDHDGGKEVAEAKAEELNSYMLPEEKEVFGTEYKVVEKTLD